MPNALALSSHQRPRLLKKPKRRAFRMSDRKREAFIAALSISGKVPDAARAAGYENIPTQLYTLRRRDPEFAAEWDDAIQIAGDHLEAEAIRRAKEGVNEPIMYKGRVVGWKVNYSDQLLMMLLKGMNPSRHRDSRVHHDGTIDHNVGVAVMPMTAKNAVDWEKQSLLVHQNQKTIDITPKDVTEEKSNEMRRS